MKIEQEIVVSSHPLSQPRQQAERIVEAIYKAKRIIIVTGAGISVSAGIPDFRSADGLYNAVKKRYPQAKFKGKDLFDAGVFHCPEKAKCFYSFISEIKKLIDAASPTKTHEFIRKLASSTKLLRCYTQNIDSLEARSGLTSEMFNFKSQVVMLHGNLSHVICTICKSRSVFSPDHLAVFENGVSMPCTECSKRSLERTVQNKRALSVGFMRPDIVLYNETHSAGDWISEVVSKDLSKRPDLLIVMGTSLKVDGIKKVIRDVSRAIHETQPSDKISTILMNKTDLGVSEWKGIFDARWIGAVDEILAFVESGMESREKRKNSRKKPSVVAVDIERKQPTILQKFHVVKKNNITHEDTMTVMKENVINDEDHGRKLNKCSRKKSNKQVLVNV